MVVAGAFSPNGDGKNDAWIITGITDYPNNTVTIFNRWGSKIFQIDGYDNESRVWFGQTNTGIHTGSNEAIFTTYYYVIDLKNGSKPISGHILFSK